MTEIHEIHFPPFEKSSVTQSEKIRESKDALIRTAR